MRAAIYCRVSSKEQVENFSLPVQEASCREYCERQGWHVAEVYVERGESAKTAERTEFQRMLDDLRECGGRIHYVIVYNLSRFARSKHDHMVVRAFLHRVGVRLRSVTEPIDEGATGQLLEGVMAAFHEFDNSLRSERSKTGMRAAVDAGRWCWRPPIGYLSDEGLLRPDPDVAPLVVEAFRRVAGGESADSVHQDLGPRGLETTRSNFYKLLGRRIYAGWIEVPSWGVVRKGIHEELVDEATFAKAQLALAGEANRLYLVNNPDFPLRRFITCGTCGSGLTGGWSKGRKGKRYGYYRCSTRGCGRNIPKLELEEDFVELLRKVQPTEGYVRLFQEILLDVWQEGWEEAKAERRRLEAKLRAIERKRERLIEAHIYEQSIDREIYDQQMDRLNQARAVTQVEMSDAQHDELDAEGILNWGGHVARNAARLWIEGNTEQRQRFQNFIFPEGVTRSDDGELLNPRISRLFRYFGSESESSVSDGRPNWTWLESAAILHQLAELRFQMEKTA